MPISDWPENERPREKLITHGPGALSDAELLALFIRTGVRRQSALDLARDWLGVFGSLRGSPTAHREAETAKAHRG